jgi:intracellular multiplication protein IcmC
MLKLLQAAIKPFSIVLLTCGIFYTNSVYAAVSIDISTVLENFSKSVPNLTRLAVALAYVFGMYFVVKGIFALKQYGESRTMMSSGSELRAPMVYMGVGAALLYLPTTIRTGMSTFWKNPTPYAYVDQIPAPFTEFLTTVFMIIQLVGVIAVIRGLLMLTHMGQSQQGGFGKAMTHMIAGIFCINMYQFVKTIANTLGLGAI